MRDFAEADRMRFGFSRFVAIQFWALEAGGLTFEEARANWERGIENACFVPIRSNLDSLFSVSYGSF